MINLPPLNSLTKYSFLLPAYKSRYLFYALQSIQQQSFRNFKVIISDDCSPEPIEEIVRPFLEDSRFIYRRNPNNIGAKNLVTHWNLLLELIDSEYVIIAGDDDIYDVRFLEEVDSLVKRYNQVDLIRSCVKRIDENGKTLKTEKAASSFLSPDTFLSDYFLPTHIHCIGNYVFRSTALKEKGGFVDYPYAWFSDDETCLQLCQNGIAIIQEPLFSFRSSGINISSLYQDSTIARAIVRATCSFYHSFRKQRIYRQFCTKKVQTHCYNYCYRMIIDNLHNLTFADIIHVAKAFQSVRILCSWTKAKLM